MSAEAQRHVFVIEMDKLRRGPKRVEPSDVAELARKVGLPPHEALLKIQEYGERGQQRSGESFDALAVFISSLCSHVKTNRVLEYASVPSLLTAHLLEDREFRSISYLAPYDHVAKTLRILFDDKVAKVAQSTAELEKDAVFDAIVCAPPIGNRPQKDDGADGLGGEVVRQLAPLLAEGGTLYWVTGRAVVFSQRAKKTLVDLQNDGLNAVATIDIAPGAFYGTAIEGGVIALRRGVLAKRFVGLLRDLEMAAPMASALLAGPSRKLVKAGHGWILKINARSKILSIPVCFKSSHPGDATQLCLWPPFF